MNIDQRTILGSLALSLLSLTAACASSDAASTGDDQNVTGTPGQALQGAERKAFLDAVRKDFFQITERSEPSVEFIVDEMSNVTPPATGRGDIRVSLVAPPVKPGTTTPYDFHGTAVQHWIDEGKMGAVKLEGSWERNGGEWGVSGQVVLGKILYFDGGSFVRGGRVSGAPRPGPSTSLSGSFERQHKEDGISAKFTIKSVTQSELVFDLTAVLTSPGEHNGVIQNGKAQTGGSNDTFVFTEGSDCEIALVFSDAHDACKVTQKGPCDDAGFGAFVDVTGQYKKK